MDMVGWLTTASLFTGWSPLVLGRFGVNVGDAVIVICVYRLQLYLSKLPKNIFGKHTFFLNGRIEHLFLSNIGDPRNVIIQEP